MTTERRTPHRGGWGVRSLSASEPGGVIPAGGREAPRGREPLSRNLPVGDKPVGAEAGDMGHL